MLELFKIDYQYSPSNADASIIYAESEQEAIKFAKDKSDQKIESIEKIKPEKGVLYTGYNCC